MDDAQIIVGQLQKAGFTQVELKPMDVPTQQKKRVSGDYQMFIDGFSLPCPIRISTQSGSAAAALRKARGLRG
jgi:ABC-type transport system substrate-binding protein